MKTILSRTSCANFILMLLFLTVMLSSARSQSIADYTDAMDSAFKAADFQETLHHGRKLLEFNDLQKETAVKVHETLAISFFHTTQLDSSKQHFINLLNLNDHATLDPIRTSPKILRFFEDIRKDYQSITRLQRPETESEPTIINKILPNTDVRPSAGIRSLFLPGLGQWHKGHKARAILFGGSVVGLAGATAVIWLKEQDAKEAYDAAKFFPEIDSSYNLYNERQKNRKTLLLAAGLTWGLAILDAFRSPYVQPTISADAQSGLQTELKLQIYLR